MAERNIADFWNEHPVGADFIASTDWPAFFREYDERRDRTEPHIREELARLDVRGKRVLELGTGHGTESARLIDAGADYVGADFTGESLARLKRRFELHGQRPVGLVRMTGERLGFADASFDLIFSHGVIHHSPNTEAIVAEFRRVLRPGGKAVVMLYHRDSLNYQLSIRVIRRLGLLALAVPGVLPAVARLTGEPPRRLALHLENLRREGLGYLALPRFLHASTDGPDNPFSRVFSANQARQLFRDFDQVETRVHHLNERHFPGAGVLPQPWRLALGRRFGWHLWITATK